jgi:hypothetical protein
VPEASSAAGPLCIRAILADEKGGRKGGSETGIDISDIFDTLTCLKQAGVTGGQEEDGRWTQLQGELRASPRYSVRQA